MYFCHHFLFFYESSFRGLWNSFNRFVGLSRIIFCTFFSSRRDILEAGQKWHVFAGFTSGNPSSDWQSLRYFKKLNSTIFVLDLERLRKFTISGHPSGLPLEDGLSMISGYFLLWGQAQKLYRLILIKKLYKESNYLYQNKYKLSSIFCSPYILYWL